MRGEERRGGEGKGRGREKRGGEESREGREQEGGKEEKTGREGMRRRKMLHSTSHTSTP